MKPIDMIKRAISKSPKLPDAATIDDVDAIVSAIIMTTKEPQTRDLAFLALEAIGKLKTS